MHRKECKQRKRFRTHDSTATTCCLNVEIQYSTANDGPSPQVCGPVRKWRHCAQKGKRETKNECESQCITQRRDRPSKYSNTHILDIAKQLLRRERFHAFCLTDKDFIRALDSVQALLRAQHLLLKQQPNAVHMSYKRQQARNIQQSNTWNTKREPKQRG